jgi:pyridoxal phosphate enzyme (YggS family)
MTASAVDPPRRAELEAALAEVHERISAACRAAGRDPADVGLIAVTKTRPALDVAALADLGVRDFGESRDQEASAKVDEVSRLLDVDVADALRWHFVGQLQSRKCRTVAAYASAVHSVDRVGLAAKLSDGLDRAERPSLDVFVQVSLDGDVDRGGTTAEDLDEVVDDVAGRARLRLRGLMAVPPQGADPDDAFARLAELTERVRAQHPSVDAMSAGMSDDLEAAVRNGSTYVRVGTALLGRRPPVFG